MLCVSEVGLTPNHHLPYHPWIHVHIYLYYNEWLMFMINLEVNIPVPWILVEFCLIKIGAKQLILEARRHPHHPRLRVPSFQSRRIQDLHLLAAPLGPRVPDPCHSGPCSSCDQEKTLEFQVFDPGNFTGFHEHDGLIPRSWAFFLGGGSWQCWLVK